MTKFAHNYSRRFSPSANTEATAKEMTAEDVTKSAKYRNPVCGKTSSIHNAHKQAEIVGGKS